MDSDAHSEPLQTKLVIDFLIVGGGLAGLACAVALRRVGHRVLVLERNPSINLAHGGGCRMAPNLSKILYHWGLREQLESIALRSQAIDLLIYETGEVLGTHIWDEEMLRETRGDFLFVHYADLRKLLYDSAVSLGAEFRFNCRVSSIDPDSRAVMLVSGEVLKADVIVGADGISGKSRQFFEEDEAPPHKLNLYSTTISKKLITNDNDLSYLYSRKYTSMFSWFGNTHCGLVFPLGGTPSLGLFVYGAADGHESTWEDEAPLKAMQRFMEPCEPRLRKLGRLAEPPVCLPVIDYPELEDWVHDSGRMVIIGQAAHPLPPGAIQKCALAVEDGAVLAKLFSHLGSADQISNFLYAFQDLRQPRCTAVLKKEFGDIHFMTLPPGDMQNYRDQSMRAKRDAGLDVLDASGDSEETPEWTEIKEVFGYDAEDEADNWWMEWGLLRERAQGRDLGCGLFDNVVVEQQTAPPKSIPMFPPRVRHGKFS